MPRTCSESSLDSCCSRSSVAGLLVFLKNFVSAYTHRWLMIIGGIYILLMLYFPGGLAEVVQRVTKSLDRK